MSPRTDLPPILAALSDGPVIAKTQVLNLQQGIHTKALGREIPQAVGNSVKDAGSEALDGISMQDPDFVTALTFVNSSENSRTSEEEMPKGRTPSNGQSWTK